MTAPKDADFSVVGSNGPISLTGLAGTLSDAKNGPLTLKVPDGFSSGVRVETSSHSPFSCRGAACDGARRQDGNRTRLFEIGTENATVKIWTANGPVSIVSSNRS